ncbi:MAG: ATP-binding cassette domain-containing protein [Burkholderiaceae bacterium]|nr:ATP-binding cassette domain-containing protein [Burkholderiaceae bacterium]
MAERLLEAEGLVKRYGGVIATDRVSLAVARGEVLGVIGPNGAGKSTLVGLLGGALTADEGTIRYDGADIGRLPAPERARRGIGRTYQIPRPFLDMTVRENLLAARYSLQPLARRADAEAACARVLERCGLADAAGLSARALPLLRRKRLEVARALALDPQLLLLDEVGAGLVDAEVSELIALIRSLRSEVKSIVIIEHVLRIVRECCDRLVVIHFGRVFAEGATVDVLASDEVATVYLGTAHGAMKAVAADAANSPGGAGEAEGTEGTEGPRGAGSADSESESESEGGPTAEVCRLAAALVAPVSVPVEATMVPLLVLRGVHAGYGQARILEGIDLAVVRQRVVAILGTNGAGKTTLASVIAGMLRPTAGNVRVDGRDVTGSAPHIVADLGIAQCMEGRRIFASLSVEENLLVAARSAGAAERTERLNAVYAMFPDLEARRGHAGTSMSGGQQQMLAIGRALMNRPRLVVFDEISLGLAPIVLDRLYAALAALKRAGLTMLIVEQDVERALALADDVHVLEHGRIALSGTARTVRDDTRLRHLYIGAED